MKCRHLLFFPLVFILVPAQLTAQTAWREDFNSLSGWKEFSFPSISRHSTYSTLKTENNKTVLRTQSNKSASAIISTKEFDPNNLPILRWSWKVENVFKSGDATKAAGDDFPIRIIIMFFDEENVGFWDRVGKSVSRLISDIPDPSYSLQYIWANREHPKRLLKSTHNDKTVLIITRSGSKQVSQWLNEQVNISADFKLAFGGSPPRKARIAIMNDSDATQETARSYIDWIEQAKN